MYAPVYDREWREDIREDGNFVGGIVMLITAALSLGFTVLIVGLTAAGVLTPDQLKLEDLGLGNTGYMLFYAVTYAVCMGVPPLLICLLFRRRLPRIAAVNRQFASTKILAFFIGMGGCAVANYVASYVAAILNGFGIMPPENPTHMEGTPQSLLINLFALALLPALLEELAFRKCIIGTLQKYGKGIAVVISALLFGVVHGGIAQSVFAFIVGLVLGFITVKTGSVRIAAAVHFANNALSVLTEYLTLGMDETARSVANVAVLFITGFGGIAALVVALVSKNELFARSPQAPAPSGRVVKTLWGAPLMIIMTVLIVLRILYANIT